jgi:dienelactone hydrolase
MMKAITADPPSYGVFSPARLHFLTRGTNDRLIGDSAVKEFTDALVKAGQRAEYVQAGGASHAFFDWKPLLHLDSVLTRWRRQFLPVCPAFI